MADTRTPEEKRADNLKDMIVSGHKDPRTLSEGSKKVLSKRFGTSFDGSPSGGSASDGRDVSKDDVVLAQGTFKVGQTPFEQIQAGKGAFYDSMKMGAERFRVTEKYNPEGLSYAMSVSPYDYPEEYRKASDKAVSERMYIQNVSLFEQSAMGDLLNEGLFVSMPVINGYDSSGNPIFEKDDSGKIKQYLAVSDKGKNLGYENIYTLEDNAIWGKAFDFIFSDDKVYLYPEGTRKSMKEAGFDVLKDAPLIFEKDGESFLVMQKEGRNTINVKAINPDKNQLGPDTSVDISQFLDLSKYEVSPGAIFNYSITEGGLDVSATGLTEIPESPGGWKESTPQLAWKESPTVLPWKENETQLAWKDNYMTVVGTDSIGNQILGLAGDEVKIVSWNGFTEQGGAFVRDGYSIEKTGAGYVNVAKFEIDNSTFINPRGIPYNPENPMEYNMFGPISGVIPWLPSSREFFQSDYAKGAQEWVHGFEGDITLPGLPGTQVTIQPSEIVGFAVRIPETLTKGGLGTAGVLVGLTADYNPLYGEKEKQIAKGSGIDALFGGMVYAPSTAVYLSLAFAPNPSQSSILGIGKQPPISQVATSLTGALTKGTIGEAVFGKAFTWTAEATAQGVAQGATFAATQTVIEFGGKVAMKFASDDFENWAGAQGGKLTNPTGGDEYASIGWKDSNPMLAWKESEIAPPWNPQDYPEVTVPQGKFQNPALDLIWSVGEAAKEMTTDKEAQGRITAAFGLGFAFGFGKTVVSSDAIQGGIAKAKALPGRYMDATYQVLGGGGDAVAPMFDFAGNKFIKATAPTEFGMSFPSGRVRVMADGRTLVSQPAPISPELAALWSLQIPGGFKGVTRPIEMKYPKSEIVFSKTVPDSPDILREKAVFKGVIQAGMRREYAKDFLGSKGYEFDKIKPVPHMDIFAPTRGRGSEAQVRREYMREEDIQREAGRTKYELAQAARQQIKMRQDVGQGLWNPERLGIVEIPRITEIVRERTRLRPPTERPPTIVMPRIPGFGSGGSANFLKMPKQYKQPKTSYAPSLAGVLGGKIEGKIKKAYSGFEVRGIQRRKNKRGLF